MILNSKRARQISTDSWFKWLTFFFAFVIVALMVWMVTALSLESEPSINKFGFGFIFNNDWDPVHGQFGALPFIFGTVVTSVIAIVIATPISVGVAIFLT